MHIVRENRPQPWCIHSEGCCCTKANVSNERMKMLLRELSFYAECFIAGFRVFRKEAGPIVLPFSQTTVVVQNNS